MGFIERQMDFMSIFADWKWKEYSADEVALLEATIAILFFKLQTSSVHAEALEESDSDEQVNQIVKKVIKVAKYWPVKVSLLLVSSKQTPEDYGVLKVNRPGSAQPAFVDSIGRVYETWDDFLENNKLPPMEIVYPKDGTYTMFRGVIQLSSCKMPAGKIKSQILSKVDNATAYIQLASTGIKYFPPLKLAAMVGGFFSSVWIAGRGMADLIDKAKHQQNLTSKADWLQLAYALAGATMATNRIVTVGRVMAPAKK